MGLHDIPRGTSVAGVDVSGRTIADAARLIAVGGDQVRRPLVLQLPGGQEEQLDPAAAGLGIDAQASARRAASRPWSPWGIASALTGHRSFDPVISVDDAKLEAAVTKIGAGIQSEFREGDIVFNGTAPMAVAPQSGQQLAAADAVARIRGAYLVSAAPIPLPFTTSDPTLTPDEVQRALTEVAQPAVAADVTVRAGAATVVVSPSAIAAALSFAPKAGYLEPFLDGAKLLASLGSTVSGFSATPKDARFTVVNGKPVIIPSVTGRELTAEALATAVRSVLTAPAPRTAQLLLSAVEPAFTTAQATALGIKEKVGEFTTYHPCCAARVTNIHTIADIVSGTIVLPGKAFDLNGVVGERDVARGFVSAPMIDHGVFVESVGGGVSQFATTTYNAAFFGGFPIPEHQTHSYYISRYPAGREATVSWPKPDLRWVNDSKYGAMVTASYTGTSLTVTIWSTKRFDVQSISSPRYRPTTAPAIVYNTRPGCESAQGGPGFDIDVTRVFSSGGQELRRETIHTRYLPEPVIVCGPKPAPKPTATPTPTPTPTPTKPGSPAPTPKASG
ncbi:MAG: hypothetical protein QOK14_1334 [Frankiaceae bacterium]|nr:hypothetical protein [Frankiaceae bacterium]